MAYQPQMPSMKLTAEDMGVPDYHKALMNAFEGMKGAQEAAVRPQSLTEALLQAQLKNAHDRTINKYLDRSENARIGATESNTGLNSYRQKLMEAQTNAANRPDKLTGDAALLDYIIQNKDKFNQLGANSGSQVPQLGEGQPSLIPSINPANKSDDNYADKIFQHIMNKVTGTKEASQYAPSNTGKELQERADVDAGFYPGTNRTQPFENPETQKEYADVYASKTTGLKKGSHYVMGTNGERIGEVRPKTAKEREVEKGTVLFNEFFPQINEGLNAYSGEGSIGNLESDARNYKTNPAAHKRFIQFLVGDKLRTVTGVNEATRFGAGKTNQTFNRFNDTLSSFDVPKTITRLIKEYQIPASANIEAGIKFNSLLDKGENTYKKKASPNVTEYYPGKAPTETNNYSDAEIQDEAKYFGTTAELVKKAIAGGVKTEKEMRNWLKEHK